MLRKREGKLIFTQMKGLCFNCGFQNMILTVQDAQTASPYRWAALPKSTKTHRPPELRSHQGPVSSAACTAGNQKKKKGHSEYHCRSMSWVSHFQIECFKTTYLNDAVHVRDEAVNADLQQHDQGSAHILSDLRVLISSQGEQALHKDQHLV